MIRILIMTFISLALAAGQAQAKTIAEVEGNNTFSNAQVVSGFWFSNTGGTYSAVVNGNNSGATDYDYYKFSLNGASSVNLSLGNAGLMGRLGLWKYDSSTDKWTRIAVGTSTLTSPASIVQDIEAGTYILGVASKTSAAGGTGFSGGSGTGANYTLSMNYSPVPNPEPSAFLLTGMGLLGLFGVRRKFSRTSRTPADNVA